MRGGLRAIAREGEQLYKSVSDLVLYATGAAACSTSDLLMVLEAINRSLDNIERHLNRAYFETWRYIQVRIGYWKARYIAPAPCGRFSMTPSGVGAEPEDWIINDKKRRI